VADAAGAARPDLLTPRARRLLPVFLLGLVAASAYTLWFTAPARVSLAGEVMGTTWAVTLNAPDLSREDRARARQAVERALASVDDAMSTWKPESELSRLNAHASTEPFALSAATLEVLAIAQRTSERSRGAFDVTVAPLVAAWGFGAGARPPGEGPEGAELAALRQRVGFEKLSIDLVGGTATKRVPELQIDLSAVAKGYGVDRASDALARLGYRDTLVEVGGEVRATGERPGGGPWRLAIEEPDPYGRSVNAVVELADLAMATSGDYRSFYEAGGQRVTHFIDPRTGRPVQNGLASVSVVHDSAAEADAWATALSVLGPEEGMETALALRLGVYFIWRRADGGIETRATPGFPPVERAIRDDPPPSVGDDPVEDQ
jgi:thiamine biosynthesis lipoprotein